MKKRLPPRTSIVVAYQKDRGIGYQNKLPWKLREDMQHFKNLTWEHTVIMGRRTYESIGKPLDHRRNIVISQTLSSSSNEIEVYPSVQKALEQIHPDEQVFFIGGEKSFAESLLFADYLYLTLVDALEPVDRFFPLFDETQWALEEETFVEKNAWNQFSYCMKKLLRKS